jgi:hypothetical protein
MEIAKMGYYADRNRVRTPISRGILRAAFGELPQKTTIEAGDGFLIITTVGEPLFFQAQDYYLE